MWKGETAILYCDGTGWKKIAGVSIPMKCIIYLNATQSALFPTATAVKVPLNTSYVDNTGFMANLANNRIDFKRRGEYILYGAVEFNNLSVNSPRCLTQINLTGTTVANADCSGLVTGYPTPFATTSITVATTDNLSLFGYQNSGSTQGAWGLTGHIVTFIGVTEIITW
jgi:hypothetical protein